MVVVVVAKSSAAVSEPWALQATKSKSALLHGQGWKRRLQYSVVSCKCP
jgi:hypothetical protein